MSGWLDYYEDDLFCSNCNHLFKALFCEDGNPNRKPIVITSLAQDRVKCPHCKKYITYPPQQHSSKTLRS